MTDKLTDDEARTLMEEVLTDQRRGETLLRNEFLEHCDDMAQYWAKVPDLTPYERTSGAVFSILCTIDGTNGDIPAFDVISAAHMEIGNVLVEEGTLITGTRNLHGEYTKLQKVRAEAAAAEVTNDD